MISPLAYVDPAAQIGQNVEIGPFVYIEGDVRIGDDCVIMPHVSILNGATIGARNVIHQNTVICAEPQSFHFEKGQKPHVVIGDDNVIRENVLIAGSNRTEDATRIGHNNHLMNKVHIAHDVCIGDHCVLGISTSVAGACLIDDYAILSSSTIVQRGVRVGKFVLLQGGCRGKREFSSYGIFGGNPAAYHGVNSKVITAVRPETDERLLRHIANAFRMITAGNFSLEDAEIKIREQIPLSPEIDDITKFITTSENGVIRYAEEKE